MMMVIYNIANRDKGRIVDRVDSNRGSMSACNGIIRIDEGMFPCWSELKCSL
jgi:hypothetical protein